MYDSGTVQSLAAMLAKREPVELKERAAASAGFVPCLKYADVSAFASVVVFEPFFCT
jgi:hypothetical protein